MTTSDNISAASSAAKKRFAVMATRGLRRSGTSPAATPPASESLDLGVSGGVSGESGGGSFKPTSLSFDSDDVDDVEVQAFIFPELNMCGALIGRGQFFCTRSNCQTPAHSKASARSVKRTYRMYIPAAGTSQKAFCDPNIDSLGMPEEISSFIVSKRFPPSRLKMLFRQLKEDNTSMTLDQVKSTLNTFGKSSFKDRVKEVLTPAKSVIPFQTLRDQAADAFNRQQSIPDLPDVKKDDLLRGSDLLPIVEQLRLVNNAVGNAMAITNLNAKELEDVKDSGHASLLAIESTVGTDPGIGGAETGILSSAWEGITFVHDEVSEVAMKVDDVSLRIEETRVEIESDVDKAKQSMRAPMRTLQSKVEKVSDSMYAWDEKLSENVVERSGAYANELTEHIRGVVLEFVEEWMQGQEDGDGGASDVASSDAPTSAGDDLDTRAELTALQRECKRMKAELEHLKSVTTTGSLKFPTDGFEFESEEDLYLFLEESDAEAKLPSDLHTLFADLWALLDQASTAIDGENRQATDAQLARNQESSIKAKFTNPTALSRWGGFQRGMPMAFEPPNTPQSSNPILIPLPGLKDYTDWDNGSDGALGRKQLIKKKQKQILVTLTNDVKANLHSEVRELANAFRTTTKSQEQFLYEWIHETYEHESVASSKSEAWSLVAGCIRAIFEDIADARLIGRSLHGLEGLRKEARLIWAMGMACMKMEEFVAHNFSGHTSCVAVYTQYMNRARTPVSTFRKLEQKVNTMNGEVTKINASVVKLQTTVTSLKNQRGSRRNNNNRNGGDANAADAANESD